MIGRCKPLGIQDCLCTTPQQLGSVGTESSGQRIELFDEVVIELHEYFTSGHEHMLSHMVAAQNVADHVGATPSGISAFDRVIGRRDRAILPVRTARPRAGLRASCATSEHGRPTASSPPIRQRSESSPEQANPQFMNRGAVLSWSRVRGSNSPPHDYKSSALPTELTRRGRRGYRREGQPSRVMTTERRDATARPRTGKSPLPWRR